MSNVSDTIHFEAESLQEFENAFRDSIEEYLRFLEEEGVQPEPPQNPEFKIHLDDTLYRHVLRASDAQVQSIEAFLQDYLTRSFGNEA